MASAAQRNQLRDLIGDPSSATQTWSDAALEGYIDQNAEDLYAAAAYVLTIWAARLAREFDFSAPEAGSFSRSQQREALLAMAREYRKMIGSDATTGFVGAGMSVGDRTMSNERWQTTLDVTPESAGGHADPGATRVEDIEADEAI
jgi:hypothetical protein